MARTPERLRPASSRLRLFTALAAGIVAGVLVSMLWGGISGPLVGWDVAALVYVAWSWAIMLGVDARQTATLAVREDPSRAWSDVLLLSASVASLIAVGAVIGTAGSAAGAAKELHIGLGVVSVVVSWFLVHTIFTSRYARLYYTGPDGGIDFNQDDPPRYVDFAYVAFTVGMTFQVSDTDITTGSTRSAVLRHSLLSYLLGAVIIAATINLIAGLAK
jgi:uncharacterized membrane protein